MIVRIYYDGEKDYVEGYISNIENGSIIQEDSEIKPGYW